MKPNNIHELQNQLLCNIEKLVNEKWITIFSINEIYGVQDDLTYSGLISDEILSKSRNWNNWEIGIGGGMPGIVEEFNGKEKNWYYSSYYRSGIEPLLIHRSFSKQKKAYYELTEDFRLYFNLYFDSEKSIYTRILDDGSEETVVKFKSHLVEVNRTLILEYLAVRKLNLVLYFELVRYSDQVIDVKSYSIKKDDLSCTFYIQKYGDNSDDNLIKSVITLNGKKILRYETDFDSDENEKNAKKYAEFEFNPTAENNYISKFSCQPDKLKKSYDNIIDTPHYLQIVTFKKEVLDKYLEKPHLYTVDDGVVIAPGLWILRIDNNHPTNVNVFLKELYCLPYKEQNHWKNFNIISVDCLSKTAIVRNLLGEFCDPLSIELIFKQKYIQLNKTWLSKFKWELFKPLAEEDTHHWKSLRLIDDGNQKAFDETILSLVKLLIDSLNEESISEENESLRSHSKGIDKFEYFLKIHFSESSTEIISFLRDLQKLRSKGVAHRKGSSYYNALQKFDSNMTENLVSILNSIFTKSNCMLDQLMSLTAS